MKTFRFLFGCVWPVVVCGCLTAKPPNVLFLSVDDLRPELAVYGATHMHTPNMDRLANAGTLFERAYAMVATCGASRASMLSGVRPSPSRFVTFLASAEKEVPGVATLNTHFKAHGYRTISLGKIFHHAEDSAAGWSEEPWRPMLSTSKTYHQPESLEIMAQAEDVPKQLHGPAYEAADQPDEKYPDGEVAAKAVTALRELAQQDRPWFLGVGFFKPHLPFVCPQKYWNLYPRESIRLPDNNFAPKNAPAASIHTNAELRQYGGEIPRQGPVSEETAINLIHGYYACVSFIDAQIGKVLDALESTGQAGNTIIVLWGDHGWNLLEHTLWQKHTCYETSMRIPLVIVSPEHEAGRRSDALVESIDLYPTLSELAGLPLPDHLQGDSLVPVLNGEAPPGEPYAVSRMRLGDTIRTDAHRYAFYRTRNGEDAGHMLYDHRVDPDENHSLAVYPEYAETVAVLRDKLEATIAEAEQAKVAAESP